MGNVKIQYGIGYSSATQTQYIDMAAARDMEPARPYMEEPIPDDKLAVLPWSPWGVNNLLPLEMVADIKTTPILTGISEGRARFALGNGMLPAIVHHNEKGERVIDKIVDDPEIWEFMDTNNQFLQTYGWMKDQIAFHRGMARYGLNKGRTRIASMRRDDVTSVRFSKMDGRGRISHAWYSAQWNKVRSADSEFVFRRPLLNLNNPYKNLRDRIDGGDKNTEFAISVTHPGWDEIYYPTPLWYAAYKWVKIAQAVPEMKAAMYENSMRLKYIVIIQESFWGRAYPGFSKLSKEEKEKARNKVYDEIDEYLVGAKNAGKAIFTTGYRDREGRTWADIEIKPIENNETGKEYLPDSAAANSEIAFASLFNPAIIGASLPSGPYTNSQGGSSVRESVLVQVVMHELERQQIRSIMNVVKYFNGWHKRLPGLDFIIPATILTTLDTGAGSKPVVTGGIKPKEDGNN